MNDYTKSKAIYQQSCEVLPGGVNSPVRSFRVVKHQPMIVERGVGDQLYDVDGNRFIDFCCGWGSLIHGHAHPTIVEAAQKRIAMGSSFGITTEIELKLAKKIIEDIPSIEMIRFVSSGTEATMTALRVARGYTGRKTIVKFSGHYHGHADCLLVQAGSGVFNLTSTSTSAGIPDGVIRHTISLPFNAIDTVKNFLNNPEYSNDIAAVILEPVGGNMGVVPGDPEFLMMLREETHKIGAVLIFDEVKCGYRMPQKTAQKMYGITPDLTCLAKVIGGGFPAAAFGGKKEIMQVLAPLGQVYQAGTLSGNPVAMTAGLVALELLDKPGTYEELQRKVDVIVKPVREYIERHDINACIQNRGAMFNLFFGKKSVKNKDDASQLDTQKFSECFAYLFSKGIYVSPSPYESWFVSTVHTQEHLEQARDVLLSYLKL